MFLSVYFDVRKSGRNLYFGVTKNVRTFYTGKDRYTRTKLFLPPFVSGHFPFRRFLLRDLRFGFLSTATQINEMKLNPEKASVKGEFIPSKVVAVIRSARWRWRLQFVSRS